MQMGMDLVSTQIPVEFIPVSNAILKPLTEAITWNGGVIAVVGIILLATSYWLMKSESKAAET